MYLGGELGEDPEDVIPTGSAFFAVVGSPRSEGLAEGYEYGGLT
jgi:hypothetical protein